MVIDLEIPEQDLVIGLNLQATTTLPNIKKKNDVAFIDFPGFGDTRSLSNEILNSYYLSRISECSRSIKIVFVIKYGIEKLNKGNFLIELFNQLLSLNTDHKMLFNCLSIVITDCPITYRPSDFIAQLERIIEDNNSCSQIRSFLESLSRSKGKISIFHSPRDDLTVDLSDKNQIFNCINWTSHFLSLNLSVQIGAEGKLAFRNIITNFEKEIIENITLIRENLESLNLFQLLLLKFWLCSITNYFPKYRDNKDLSLKIYSKENFNSATNNIIEILLFLACVGNLAKRIYDDSNWITSLKTLSSDVENRYNEVKFPQDCERNLRVSRLCVENLKKQNAIKERRIKEMEIENERIRQSEIEQRRRHEEELRRIQSIQRSVVYEYHGGGGSRCRIF